MRYLVLGGSRFLGLNLVRRLMSAGHVVTIFNRGTRPDSMVPKGTRIVHGDRNSSSDLEKIEDIVFDAVFDFSGYTPQQTELALARFKGRTNQYIYCSTAAVYAETAVFPLTEDSALGSWPLWGSYGRDKLSSEQILWGAYQGFGFPITVIRPVYILGPANYVDREAFILKRLLAEAPILVPGTGNALVQFVLVEEVVEALMLILQKQAVSIGNAYNCCGDEFITLNGLVELFGNVAQKRPIIQHVDLEDFGISPIPYDAEDIFPFSNSHFICSNSKLKSEIGFSSFRSLEDSIRMLCQWYRENCDLDLAQPSDREAQILSGRFAT